MTTDRWLAVVLVALSATGTALAWQMPNLSFNNDPGPALFPLFACSVMALCGVVIGLRGGAETASAPDPAAVRRGLAISALLVGYAMALWLVGYLMSTLIMSFAFYWLIAGPKRQLWRGLVFAGLATAGLHLLFAEALNAFLPRGLWF